MKNSMTALPEFYREYGSVDLQNDKKLALLVNGIALVIMVAMFVPAMLLMPISSLLLTADGELISGGALFLRLVVLIVGMVGYLVLHELTHAAVMKAYGVQKVKFGFTGLYAFAGCDEYIRKGPYLLVALAPIVVWGVILLIVNLLVPPSWFWIVYILQVGNVSGAAGDLYVTCRFGRLPADTYIRDTGVAMTVYTKE